MTWSFKGLFIGYLVCAASILIGMLMGRAGTKELKLFPMHALIFYFIAVLVWRPIAGLLQHTPIPFSWISYLAVVLDAVLSGLWGKVLAQFTLPDKSHKRGTRVSSLKNSRFTKLPTSKGLTLAGQPVPEADETKHFKMIGTTGTGKSTAIRELLSGALKRGDRAVIADPDGSYLNTFYDPKRGDLILNPFDSRAVRWDLFGEMSVIHDADQLARSLIADVEGPESSWRNYARVFLTSLLRQLHRVKHKDVGELYSLIATTHLAVLEHIAQQSGPNTLSVRDWVRNGQGSAGVLFLPYRANEIATLRGVISTWMRLAIYEAMSEPQQEYDSAQRLWFAIDELDALGAIDGLKDALARLRKFGGRCVLGFQSIAQVAGSFGRAEAQTIVENCGNTLILRCSASEGGGTARFASTLIGEREVTREQVTKSRGGGVILASDHRSVSTSLQPVTESAVLPSEIEQLPDLQGFLKFASQPHWQRVKLSISPRAR
jgi:type IV secretory pathway TraG/TraD family ATPase VirD4